MWRPLPWLIKMASGWKRHWKRYAAIAAISVILVGGLVLQADPRDLADKLASVDLFLLGAAVALFLLSILLRAVRWHVLLLAADQKLRFRTSLVQLLVGQALNDLTPVKVLGDAVRIVGVNKEACVPIGSGLASIVEEKLMDVMLVTAVMIVSAVLLFPIMPFQAWMVITAVVGLVVLANIVILLVLRHPDIISKAGSVATRAARRLRRGEGADRLEGALDKTARSFGQALVNSQGANRRLTMAAAGLTVPIWALEFGRLFMVMAALGSIASLPAVVVASTLSITAQVFLPAGSGSVAVVSDVFAATGVALTTAAAAGILSVATSIWLTVPLALLALLVTGTRIDTEEAQRLEVL